MGKYKIDGEMYDIDVPGIDKWTDKQVLAYFDDHGPQKAKPTTTPKAPQDDSGGFFDGEYMSAGDTLSGAGSNLASSGIKAGDDMLQMIKHPVETAKSIYGLGKGVVQLLIPGEQGSEDMARAVGKHFKRRYGTLSKIQKTFATDPIGFALDLSGLVSGGGMAAVGAGKAIAKAGQVGGKLGLGKIPAMATAGTAVEKAGMMGRNLAKPGAVATPMNAMQKAGNALASGGRATAKFANKYDPLTLAAKGVSKSIRVIGNLLGELQGVATGRGGIATKEAFRAGMKGNKSKIMGGSKEFEAGMHHLEDADVVVARAEAMLQEMADARKQSYVAKLENMVKMNKTGKYNMNVTPIYDKLVELSQSLQDKATGRYSVITDPAEQAKLVKIGEEVIKILNDPGMHNALGMDHLKKMLDNINIPHGATEAHKQAGRIRATMSNMVKKEIKKVVPQYEAMLKPYEEGIRLERDLKKAFAIGQDAGIDTIIRKLQSALSEGVHSGLGTKRKTLNQLDPSGKLATQLSGHALSTPMPTGIMRANMGLGASLGGGGGFVVGGPAGAAVGAAATIAAQSPKLTGKLNYNLGRLAAPFHKAGTAVGPTGGLNIGRGLVQAGRYKKEEDKKKKKKKKY